MVRQKEKRFYDQLGETPGLPKDLFPEIEKRIRREKTARKAIWSTAAALVVALGLTAAALLNNGANPGGSGDEEILDELSMAYEYMHGLDVENELDRYAISGVFVSDIDGSE
jgi:hypothetical protein